MKDFLPLTSIISKPANSVSVGEFGFISELQNSTFLVGEYKDKPAIVLVEGEGTNFGVGFAASYYGNALVIKDARLEFNPATLVPAHSDNKSGPGWLLLNQDGLYIHAAFNSSFSGARVRLTDQICSHDNYDYRIEHWRVVATIDGNPVVIFQR